MAYTLTLGEQAQRKNIVCIFDNTEEPISTPGRDRTLLMKFEQADRL